MEEKKERQLNYELLRILAMLMIVCLHYLSKGGILGDPARGVMGASGYTAWLIEAFCLVAVNAYVLISGYFGAVSSPQTAADILRRPLRIWCQVITYSAGIGLAALAAGWQEFDIYQVFQYLFPVVTEHYWFATSYIVLCLLMPFLESGVRQMGQRAFRAVLFGLLLLFSVAKTVIPMQLPWDKYGYDAYWFVVLYLTGAYIRQYGLSAINSRKKALAVYVLSALGIFASFVTLRGLFFRTGSFGAMLHYGYTYNFLLCYIGAVGFFMIFYSYGRTGRKGNRKKQYITLLERMAAATFGVYLIHEHINIRDKWGLFVDAGQVSEMPVLLFLVKMVLTVLLVYLVCTGIEMFRQWMVKLIGQVLRRP